MLDVGVMSSSPTLGIKLSKKKSQKPQTQKRNIRVIGIIFCVVVLFGTVSCPGLPELVSLLTDAEVA